MLSILPTLRFIQWSKAARVAAGAVPAAAAVARVRSFLLLEMGVLAVIPLMATMMAHGVSSLR